MADIDRTNTRDYTGREHTGGATLAPLGDLDDYKVADGDPDIRGWKVKTADGEKIGKVHEMIADIEAMRVRYLDVDLDKDFRQGEKERHVLVPIGCARLDEKDDEVFVDSVSRTSLGTIPRYEHRGITRELESSLRGCYNADTTGARGTGTKAGTAAAGAGAAASAGEHDFYADDLYDDRGFWGNRRRGREDAAYLTRSEEELAIGKRATKAGEVDVRKSVETEHVSKEVPVTRERVTVDREPARAGMSGQTRIDGDEIRIPVHEEQPVVEKRTVPKEEVVIRKEATTDRKTVEADLKKERLHVDTKGNVQRADKR